MMSGHLVAKNINVTKHAPTKYRVGFDLCSNAGENGLLLLNSDRHIVVPMNYTQEQIEQAIRQHLFKLEAQRGKNIEAKGGDKTLPQLNAHFKKKELARA